MRSLRITAVALIASCAVVLTGCGGDDTEPAAGDSTPTAETSVTPDESDSATPETTESTDAGDVADFPEVDGFTYTEFPAGYLKRLDATLKETPPVEGGDAKLVEKGGQEVGLVIRAALDPEAASAADFEEGFLPGFAGGVASGVDPVYKDINGTKVIIIEVPDQGLTAYAWLEGSIATSLLFKDAADAEAFAQGALA